VGPLDGLDAEEERKILHCPKSNIDHPVRSTSCTDWATRLQRMEENHGGLGREQLREGTGFEPGSSVKSLDCDASLVFGHVKSIDSCM
jgi:hypothetical protein